MVCWVNLCLMAFIKILLRRRTRFTEIAPLYFYPVPNSTKSTAFEILCKNRKCWSNRFRGKVTCPQLYSSVYDESDRTSGLAGYRQVCHFVCFFSVRTTVARAYRPQFLRYRMKICRRLPHWWECRFEKIWGRTPWEFFPKFFVRDIDLKFV